MRASPSDPLAALAEEYWKARLEADPLFATVLGYHEYDARLPDITPEGLSRAKGMFESVIARCGEIREESLSALERLTRTALLVDARGQSDYLSCRLGDWTVDPLEGPQVALLNVESYQPVGTYEQGMAMARRWNAVGPFIDDHIQNLRRGLSDGRVAQRACVEKVVHGIQDEMTKPDRAWAFLRPLEDPHGDWSEAERQDFRGAIAGALAQSIRPAYSRYLDFLMTEVLPISRLDERPGIMHVPGGAESYARLIKVHTSLDISPDAIHQIGLKEVARINSEMAELGGRVFGSRNAKKTIERLRTDPSLYFGSRDEVAEKAEAALAKASSAIADWFGRLPKAGCGVVRMEEHEEKNSTIAYYRQPAADGSRPGRYYINTSAPETRPRYEAEALAYHESIPGHHLQIAIAQELRGIPDFRRHAGVTAFVEGWGLYSERLADEMGLYTSDLDRIGMVSYDAWRACRLVVDTGMHAMGWTRAQAIDFMLENTALAKNNIANEVDRYITWPGQALAYKTGQLEMMRLRSDAESKLGDKFDIKEFHDALLGNGALPLEALRSVINDNANRVNG